jgi:peptidoglycan glycosyltransferase
MFTRPGWSKPIHDHTGDHTHGQLDLATALAVSCNVYFGQLGLALGPEPLVGLRVAGVEVGYANLLDPGPAGSRQLASTAFGQGAMVMSAMEAARLVAAIGGGGHYRRCAPTMELAAPCSDVALVGDPAALAPILAGMRRVMTAGTGAGLTSPAGLRVYGKTGTADVRGFAGEQPWGIAPAQVAPPHSWFVAFAEPASQPEGAAIARGRIAVAVVIPRGGTGASAAGPLAMQILAAAQGLGYLR